MHENDTVGQDLESQESALPEHDPYKGVRHPQVKLALMKFDRDVIDNVKDWPVKKYDGALLTADFIDDDFFRVYSLADYLRTNGIVQFEKLGVKLQAFSADQLRIFMLLGAAAKEARNEDMIIPIGIIGWRAFARNKFKDVPSAVYYVLGEHELRTQLTIKGGIIIPNEKV